MANQKLISARINIEVLERLATETRVSGKSRNGILNAGAVLWVKLRESYLSYRMYRYNQEARRQIIRELIKDLFPLTPDDLEDLSKF